MNWRERISVNPSVCHGKACVTGTRVLVSTILDSLADDCKEDEILRQYLSLKHDDIRAAISYGAELARERRGKKGTGSLLAKLQPLRQERR